MSLIGSAFATTGEKIHNPGTRDEICTELGAQAEAYYTGDYSYEKLQTLSGAQSATDSYAATKNNELYTALNALMSSTHINSFSYSSLPSDYVYTDCENGAADDTMMCLWAGRVATWNGSYFNREHVWPKSHASFYQTNGGSDRHHLRPVSASVNQGPHWHRPFGEATNGMIAYDEVGNVGGMYTSSGGSMDIGVFEPADNAKGDTARILLYLYVRWQQPNLYSDVAHENLPALDADDSANDGARVIENLETLLDWCELDPVDTWEMGRNDAIERIQGNRNVFIDYPELAWQLFGLEVPTYLTTPTSAGCSHVWTETGRTAATCLTDGEVNRFCSVCGKEKTEVLKALGHIDEDKDNTCDRCGQQLAHNTPYAYTVAPLDGAKLVIYNKMQGVVMGETAAAGKVQGVEAAPDNGILYPPVNSAIFTVEYAKDSTTDFYLKQNGKYLTTAAKGGTLSYEAEANDYSLWYLEKKTEVNGGDGVYIRSRNAAYNGNKNQAIECYEDGFSVYGITSTTSYNKQFTYELYAEDETAACAHNSTELRGAYGGTCTTDGYTGDTCTDGYTGDTWCLLCNTKIATGTVITAPGHSWDGGVVTTEPTQTEAGVKTFTCTRCDETKTESIPATGVWVNPFTDVPAGKWYTDAVEFAVTNELFFGTSDNTFSPDGDMTRAMLVTVLWRLDGKTAPTGNNPFTDVPSGKWYTEAVVWAAENGVVTGVGNNKFNPDGNITREQMAAILYRYAGKKGYDTAKRADLSTYPDGNKTSSWAKEALSWANAEGLIAGSSQGGKVYLLPTGNASRAQVASILMRYVNNIVKK